ncbi:VrrA/YqfQ family protein [Bacillus sp. JCM 19034]|uniref:VrrA/YqfQ family protein n=1 Tax=Bacillus sp. JCM 19034 TaxID=1481928 RepID=UPI0007826FF4|nr:VrrA/YqfQ family protein [Bacillus sp. JCM 19034]
MHQFGPPFGSIPMQSTMTGSMFPPPSPTALPGGAPGSLFQGGSGGFGGLLSRLFGIGGGATQSMGGAAQSMGGAIGSGLASSAGSGMNLTTMLTNAQRIVGLTQQVVPMVQQYGPLIRNMPMIWKIMRSSDNSDEVTTEEGTTPTTEDVEIDKKETKTESADSITNKNEKEERTEVSVTVEEEQSSQRSKKRETINGIPAPKLYI